MTHLRESIEMTPSTCAEMGEKPCGIKQPGKKYRDKGKDGKVSGKIQN